MFNLENSLKLQEIRDNFYSNNWRPVCQYVSEHLSLLEYLLKLKESLGESPTVKIYLDYLINIDALHIIIKFQSTKDIDYLNFVELEKYITTFKIVKEFEKQQ